MESSRASAREALGKCSIFRIRAVVGDLAWQPSLHPLARSASRRGIRLRVLLVLDNGSRRWLFGKLSDWTSNESVTHAC